MTRYLYLMRHATAEDGSFFLPDFDRELTPQGMIETARMGKFLHDKNININYIVCSSAARAFQTGRVMAEQLKYEEIKINATQSIYDDGMKGYLEVITNAPAEAQSLLLVGHNPDISFFAEYLTHSNIDSMKQASIVVVAFENLEWAKVSGRTGKFLNYHTPKQN